GELLGLDGESEGGGGRTVSPAGIEEAELDICHPRYILAGEGPKTATTILIFGDCVETVKWLCFQKFSIVVI
ncbi:MAG TPA: hypothetical protein VMB47_04140, partial [Candidatus Aquilonibacter sp.]|nr:hypothetical protein [Candidatus Aquilonibacter sp.]